MSNIPVARRKLVMAITHLEQALEFCEIAYPLLQREKPIRKTRVKSHKVRKREAGAIRHYAKLNPDDSIQEIANRFRTNPGRVSEALNGKR
jgi:hypothetical protein